MGDNPNSPSLRTQHSSSNSSASVFIRIAFDQLYKAPELRRVAGLSDALAKAKEQISTEPDLHSVEEQPVDNVDTDTVNTKGEDSESVEEVVFEVLKMACSSKVAPLACIAIDCLGKLLSYGYWKQETDTIDATATKGGVLEEAKDSQNPFEIPTGDNKTGMVSLVIEAICGAALASTGDPSADEKVQLQVIKALSSAVLAGSSIPGALSTPHSRMASQNASKTLPTQSICPDLSLTASERPANTIHSGILLQAVRTTFNIFLLARNPSTQIVAQAALTQMVQAVCGRIPKTFAPIGSALPDASEVLEQSTIVETDLELFDQNIKDIYLVLRALCKLGMKAIRANEGSTDLKSHAMRSKLLSLHLIHTIMCSHIHIFFLNAPMLFALPEGNESAPSTNEIAENCIPTNIEMKASAVDINTPTLFLHAIKPYLCLCMTRNAVSVVPQVFDVSLEIFGIVLSHLRVFLKKEVSVIFTEILLPILESKSTLVTFHQRTTLLKILKTVLSEKSSNGGQVLVEIYLNYDCDPQATTTRENIWERFVNLLSKLVTQHHQGGSGSGTSSGLNAAVAGNSIQATKSSVIRPMTTQSLTAFTKEQLKELYSTSGDFSDLKKRGVDVLVNGVLAPIVSWSWEKWKTGNNYLEASSSAGFPELEISGRNTTDPNITLSESTTNLSALALETVANPSSSGVLVDDPSQFEALRHKKHNLLEGIKTFNKKPKKGIQVLLENKSIPTQAPSDIASFILTTEGLDKNMIGEYLGEPGDENVAIMHAFVDLQDFRSVPFVQALREFLQKFRLPGEAQKIDRYMLKFAGRYVLQNPGTFSSADTAYVLAYSVIMLNTDQHNSQVKKRMTLEDFLKNNRGIDGDQDLPKDYMEAIFNEIRTNEIVLKDEQPSLKGSEALPANLRFEKAAETMALKSEERLKANNYKRSQIGSSSSLNGSTHVINNELPSVIEADAFTHIGNSGVFYTASHYEHVKSMFEVVWMSVFTALSSYLQEAEDVETIALALQGFKQAITITCMFDLELERKAFMSTLSKFTQTTNVNDIKPKNLEATRVLLELSKELGGRLGDGWMDIVLCISNVEKLQSVEVERNLSEKKRESTSKKENKFSDEAANLVASQAMTLLVDKIFTSSVNLSGPGIVGFVKALCSVSWDEITTSENSERPRMYCLQRIVEISYYNMNRIRVEWSQLWAIIGAHFNQVAAHKNSQISFFALDKLRQLAMKFLELEELPNFKFQKDFLRPFEHVLGSSRDPKMKDMALMCLQQLIQGKSKALKSGWKTVFGALLKASKDENEQVVGLALDLTKMVFKSHFDAVLANGALPDFVNCIVSFCKNKKFTKSSLQSVEILKQSVQTVLEVKPLKTSLASDSRIMNTSTSSAELPEITLSNEDPAFKLLFPILFGFYEITMTCDLEVRARGLSYLFETLKSNANNLNLDSWEVIAKGILFPIFDDLKMSRQDARKMDDRDDLTMWLNSTLIQALRLLVDLFTHEFEKMNFAVQGLLNVLMACMTQENETLARIGSTCLHQFIESNMHKFDEGLWDRVCNSFVSLFATTSPNLLFFDYQAQIPDAPSGVIAPPEGDEVVDDEVPDSSADHDVGTEAAQLRLSSGEGTVGGKSSDDLVFENGSPILAGRRKPDKSEFQSIILKCVLHLLVVQTLHEILTTSSSKSITDVTAVATTDGIIMRTMSLHHLMQLAGCFERSYRFAEAFNKDTELRLALFKMGFMKQLPNLLKQECASISAYISVLFKLVVDEQEDRSSNREQIADKLIPLCHQVLANFNIMEPGLKNRNINAWKPVIIMILNSFSELDDNLFQTYIPKIYEEAMAILIQPTLDVDVRIALHVFSVRVGVNCGLIPIDEDM